MSLTFSLSHLMLLQIAPPAAVDIAARVGYDFIGLRLLPSGPGGIAYPLMSNRALMRDTRARLADTGMRVFDIESISLNTTTALDDYLPLFQAGADLGARTVLASCYDPDPERVADNFAALCEAAAGFGLMVHLEFIPWSVIRTPMEARRMIESSQQPNARVLLDTLHLDRVGGTAQELSSLAGGLDYIHVCDALKYAGGGDEERLHTARFNRLLPGDGEIDFQPVITAIPANAVIGIEVPSTSMMERFGAEELARRALLAAKKIITAHASECDVSPDR
ncbi:sugar phosphate isomerase/epimerase [Rhizobium sp. CCGE 510]|uniref:sugar phosphate isomerase/epimerase family protein n=1 Tax=Rhizobium sp. CCGE 510 TaxID=1132836 RepID=UPI00027B8923|nr:sugar phosphate isomerase/epimerase [Rhizobium sp. CCGE 510]EJT01985.1 Xylose isomerase-like protein [Rhizobium sp. CCGE 510]